MPGDERVEFRVREAEAGAQGVRGCIETALPDDAAGK
jgi:hypothetical protein